MREIELIQFVRTESRESNIKRLLSLLYRKTFREPKAEALLDDVQLPELGHQLELPCGVHLQRARKVQLEHE